MRQGSGAREAVEAERMRQPYIVAYEGHRANYPVLRWQQGYPGLHRSLKFRLKSALISVVRAGR